jgi:hypothetical protein
MVDLILGIVCTSFRADTIDKACCNPGLNAASKVALLQRLGAVRFSFRWLGRNNGAVSPALDIRKLLASC